MSSIAKAQPGDRTASVEPDEASVSAAEDSWKPSTRPESDHPGEQFPYMGEDEEEDAEDTAEKAAPAYQFHESLSIRDFGFPKSDSRHYGKPGHHHHHHHRNSQHSDTETLDDTSDARQSGQATALYDFEADNPSELSFREGQNLTILFRQCAGWLVGEMEVEEEEEEEEEEGGDPGLKKETGTEEKVLKKEEEVEKEKEEEEEEGKGSIKAGGTVGANKRKKVVRIKKGLVPENYVQIWGS